MKMEWFGVLTVRFYTSNNGSFQHASAYSTVTAEKRSDVFDALRAMLIARNPAFDNAVIENFYAEPEQ